MAEKDAMYRAGDANDGLRGRWGRAGCRLLGEQDAVAEQGHAVADGLFGGEQGEFGALFDSERWPRTM